MCLGITDGVNYILYNHLVNIIHIYVTKCNERQLCLICVISLFKYYYRVEKNIAEINNNNTYHLEKRVKFLILFRISSFFVLNK